MAEEAKAQTSLDDIFSASSPEKSGSSEPSPAKVEAEKVEVRPIETKPAEVAPAKVEAAKEKLEVKPEVKAEAKAPVKPPEAEEKKKEDAPKIDWEAEGNPYKKRFTDTQAWAQRVNQEKQDLARQFEVINKKLDGTYDPTVDDRPKQTLDEAAIKGRVEASENAAYDIYGRQPDGQIDYEKGRQVVEAGLAKFNQEFGQHQLVQMRVLNSRTPVIEAMKVMEEAEILRELGSDPRQWKKGLEKQVRESLEKEITEKVSKDLMARVSKKDTIAPSLTEVRGAGKEMGEKPAFVPTSLDSIFSHL